MAALDQTTTYQVDPTHNGVLTGFDLQPRLERQWTVALAGAVVTPLVVNGVVYAASEAGPSGPPTLYALDEATGETIWARSSPTPPAGITYDRGRIFALDDEGVLTAIDARTGATAWSVQLPGQSSFGSPPTATGGTVYATGGGSGGTLYATDESTGALTWSQRFDGGGDSSPTVDGDAVYLTVVDTYLAFDRWNGTPLWRRNVGGPGGGGTAAVVAAGHVYIRDWNGPGGIVDAATGADESSLPADAPPVVADGAAFELTDVRSGSRLVRVADDGLGTQEWSFSGDGGLDTAPILVGGVLFIGSYPGRVYAVDPATGAQLWEAATDDPVNLGTGATATPLSSLAAGNGSLLVPAGSNLIAFGVPGIGGAAPDSTGPPSLQGHARVGEPLTVDVGVWSARATSYDVQWSRCHSDGDDCAPIGGATEATYQPDAADLGATLRASVTASNAYGVSPPYATPASDEVVENAPPLNVGAPTIAGDAEVGGTLRRTLGSWTRSPTSYDVHWLRCDDRDCQAVPQVTGDAYVVGDADAGFELAVEVTAVAPTGRSQTARSASLYVQPPPPRPAPSAPAPSAPPASGPPAPSPMPDPPAAPTSTPGTPVDAPTSPTSSAPDPAGARSDPTIALATPLAAALVFTPWETSSRTPASAVRARGGPVAAPPADRLAVPSSARASDLRHRGLRVRATCAGTCVVRLRVYARMSRGSLLAGLVTRHVTSRVGISITVKLTGGGRRALDHLRSRRLTVDGVIATAGKRTVTTSHTLVR